MNKHTPGPWNATKFNPVTGDIDDCYLYVEPGIAVIERKVKGRDQYDAANARLIAASPDLLEALEYVADIDVSGTDDSVIRFILAAAQHKARSAIASARGDE